MKWPRLFRFDPRWYKWYPELHFFDSDKERWRMLKKSGKGWPTYSLMLVFLFYGASAVVITIVIVEHFNRSMSGIIAAYLPSSSPPHLATILFSVLMNIPCLLLVYLTCFLWRKRQRRFLREKLIAKGVPICIQCGYDLRGQIDPRCPECGTGFDPKLLKNPPSTGNTSSE